MIPLRDVIPSRTTPYITLALIGLMALGWAVEIALPRGARPELLGRYGVVPADFAPATLVSAMFLHGSWTHVIGNIWALWIFGDNVEDTMGHARFAGFYLLCGSVAALGHVAMNAQSPLPAIGASGAIAGVMGAYFVTFPQSRVLTLVPLVIYNELIEVPALLIVAFWFVLQLIGVGAIAGVSGAEAGGGVAFVAHLAGFAAGAIAVLVFRGRGGGGREWNAHA